MNYTLIRPGRIIALAAMMATTFGDSRAFAAAAAAHAPEIRTRYLLLDSRIIEKTENPKLLIGHWFMTLRD